MLPHLLSISLALTSLLAINAAPVHTQLAHRLQSELNPSPPRVECLNPVTTYVCPSNVQTLPSPAGYLACKLDEPFSSSDPSRICLYKAYANFELVDYSNDESDGSFVSTRGCERWARAITTCGGDGDSEDAAGGICAGEETEHSCPDGFTLGEESEVDFECVSPTSTCYYYADSGLQELFYLDASWDGNEEGYEGANGEGCPEHAKIMSTTCERVESWRSLIERL